MCDIGHGSRSASSPTCLLSGRIPGSSREKDTCKRPAKHYAPQRYSDSCDEPILRRTYFLLILLILSACRCGLPVGQRPVVRPWSVTTASG